MSIEDSKKPVWEMQEVEYDTEEERDGKNNAICEHGYGGPCADCLNNKRKQHKKKKDGLR